MQEQTLAGLEQECLDFVARRRAVDDEELPLLEQEVRLREQRESLEAKEQKLRGDFHSFAGRTAGGGLSRPLSPQFAQDVERISVRRTTSPAGRVTPTPAALAPPPVGRSASPGRAGSLLASDGGFYPPGVLAYDAGAVAAAPMLPLYSHSAERPFPATAPPVPLTLPVAGGYRHPSPLSVGRPVVAYPDATRLGALARFQASPRRPTY